VHCSRSRLEWGRGGGRRRQERGTERKVEGNNIRLFSLGAERRKGVAPFLGGGGSSLSCHVQGGEKRSAAKSWGKDLMTRSSRQMWKGGGVNQFFSCYRRKKGHRVNNSQFRWAREGGKKRSLDLRTQGGVKNKEGGK